MQVIIWLLKLFLFISTISFLNYQETENTHLHFATDLLVQQCWILADTSDTEARRRQASFLPRKRCGNVFAAEVALTSRKKMRSCKGAEPEWKQTLCLEKVLQQSPYEHSFVPESLASPFLLPWSWWLKCWMSRNQMISQSLFCSWKICFC